jgi:hypothetical protein
MNRFRKRKSDYLEERKLLISKQQQQQQKNIPKEKHIVVLFLIYEY